MWQNDEIRGSTVSGRSSARRSSKNREIRSLQHLEAHASTARTLNLVAVMKKHRDDPEYSRAPFFHNPVLNRAIIVKHRTRPHERTDFVDERVSATKVILPIDITDMVAGAQSFFIGQRGYEDILAEFLGEGTKQNQHDENLLRLLATLPSLDPFLMRERLKQEGFEPARCYFDLTDADAALMFEFVRKEIMPLVGISIGGDVDAASNAKTAKLASKILANAGDAEMEPLRLGLGMDKNAFDEGVFCWKGFLYYKWSLSELVPMLRPVTTEIAAVQPVGPCSYDEKRYIEAARGRLASLLMRTFDSVRKTLKVYDDAFADLTRNGQPQNFRAFLMLAPGMFYDIGERIGAVQHIVSFWRFRFPAGARMGMNAEELVELLADFEYSLGGPEPEAF